jgi:agmatine deiminase
LDWAFNAYGGATDGCYWPCTLDQQIASCMIQQINQYYYYYDSDDSNVSSVSSVPSPILIQHESIASLVLEGGSIHTDGEGTILTTRECLLHANRNPDWTQNDVERRILQSTGCTKMIWLDHGLAYDEDTNGHIDNWACFIRPGHVVLAWTDNAADDPINYHHCRTAYTTLVHSTDALGRSLVVHKLYLPSPIYFTENDDVDGRSEEVKDGVMGIANRTAIATTITTTATAAATTTTNRVVGTRMAASYVNFYIANDAIIVPQFDDPVYDELARTTLHDLLANDEDGHYHHHRRTVVGIPNSRHILYGGGNIHCITQQVPKFL